MNPIRNTVLQGDCIPVMQRLASGSIDLVLTDPPYLVRYRDRHGRTVANDDNADWLKPAFAEMYRILKPGSFAISFYGWNEVDQFVAAWREAGFHIAGHLVFCKPYASSRRYLKHHHEQAYLLVKGEAPSPGDRISDVLPWDYTGNRLHPTQKPLRPLESLIKAFSKPGDLVLDPFCGSGSTLVAAQRCDRPFLGIELDKQHHFTASLRVHSAP